MRIVFDHVVRRIEEHAGVGPFQHGNVVVRIAHRQRSELKLVKCGNRSTFGLVETQAVAGNRATFVDLQ